MSTQQPTSNLGSPTGGEILSVAIEIANQTQLRKINQCHSLATIIQELCSEFKLPFQEGQYALQLNVVGTTANMYIHEQNRRQVKNGDMLKLVYSPSEMAKILINKILVFKEQASHEDSGSAWGDEAVWALSKLQDLSSDVTFAREFSDQDGLQLLVFDLLSEPKMTTTHLINCCLATLDQMMGHHFVDAISSTVLNRVVGFVDKNCHVGDSQSRTSALSILARFVSTGGYEFVNKALPVHQIIPHLCRDGERAVQKNALALLVALGQMSLQASGSDGKCVRGARDVVSRQVKEAIDKSILKDKNIDEDMAKELLNYQMLVLSSKEKKLNATVDPAEPDLVSILEASLVEQAQNRTSTTGGSRVSMGSLDEHMVIASVPTGQRIDKAASYHEMLTPQQSPPPPTPTKSRSSTGADLEPPRRVSRLALECMIYFRAAYPKPFTRVFLAETTASWQPFELTCQRLVEIIASVLCVQKKKKKKKSRKGHINKYQPLVFKEPAFFEEVFCRMFLQLGRTRRDMRARTGADQEKVLTVLQRQLAESLTMQPSTLKELTQQLRRLGYTEIAQLWAQEAKDKENWRLAHSPPILQLRQTRKEALLALIREQRINVLLKGTIFPKTSFGNQKAKRRNTYVVLSSNQKSFHYHDCDEDDRSIPGTSGKIALGEIAAVLMGQRWPTSSHTKTVSKPELVFSLVLDPGVEMGIGPPKIDLMAPDQETFDQWTDGINAILGKEMASKSLTGDLDKLLDMEVRLLLLDIDSKLIPNEPPAIPPPPPNYDFACP